jgi:8-oxo-dGTP diphosphatase
VRAVANCKHRDVSQLPFAASVALIRDDTVLLIQRAFEPFRGAWTLPGGRLESGETAEQAALREIREEVGLTAGALQPLLVLPIGERGELRLQVFVAGSFSGEIVPSDEVTDWAWIRPAAARTLTTTPDLAMVLDRAFMLFDRR